MGKTSLLARGLQQERQAGSKVVLTDFQKLNSATSISVEALLLTLAETLGDQLDLEVLPHQHWNPRRGPSLNFERYLRREILEKIPCHLCGDWMRSIACSTMIMQVRSLACFVPGTMSGPRPYGPLAAAYACHRICNRSTSIYQRPEPITLLMWVPDWRWKISLRAGGRTQSEVWRTSPRNARVEPLHQLVGGHPYLVRRGLHEMAIHSSPFAALEDRSDHDEGPFGDHLRRILLSCWPAFCSFGCGS